MSVSQTFKNIVTVCGLVIVVVFIAILATPTETMAANASIPNNKPRQNSESKVRVDSNITDHPALSKLDEDVLLTLNVRKLHGNIIKLSGKTNLPSGTKLMLSVSEKMENGYHGSSSSVVAADGTFKSVTIGSKTGLKDGQYIAEVMMPFPFVQSDKVKLVIGNNGENLKGPLVSKESDGVIVSQTVDFEIGNNPVASQAARKQESEVATSTLINSLCLHLDQLLEFKDEPEFAVWGFAIAGPYNKWMKAVEEIRDFPDSIQGSGISIPFLLRVAPTELILLGLDYMSAGGETEYTRSTLPELKEVIGYPECLSGL